MFKSNNDLPDNNSASAPPPQFGMYNEAAGGQYAQRAPPPSYEESRQMSAAGAMRMQHQQWSPPYGVQTQQQPMPPQYQYQQTGMPNAYASAYQYPQYQPIQHQYQPQHYVTTAPMMTANNFQTSGGVPVLALHKGAEIRTSASGVVNIPPPPPGCSPTPAQLAAMQGQTVLVKTKKNSFF